MDGTTVASGPVPVAVSRGPHGSNQEDHLSDEVDESIAGWADGAVDGTTVCSALRRGPHGSNQEEALSDEVDESIAGCAASTTVAATEEVGRTTAVHRQWTASATWSMSSAASSMATEERRRSWIALEFGFSGEGSFAGLPPACAADGYGLSRSTRGKGAVEAVRVRAVGPSARGCACFGMIRGCRRVTAGVAGAFVAVCVRPR